MPGTQWRESVRNSNRWEHHWRVVTRVGDTRIHDGEAFRGAVATTEGPTTVVAYIDGQRREFTVDPRRDRPGTGLGVTVAPGTNGVVVDDLGVDAYPAGRYLAALGGVADGPSLTRRAVTMLFAPAGGAVVSGVRYGFVGFTSGDFFIARGGLPAGVVFPLATLLLWLVIANVAIGLLNAVPSYPFDGGNVLWVLAREGFDRVGSFDPEVSAAAVYVATNTLFGLGLLALGVAAAL